MSTVKLHDKYFKPFISANKIDDAIQKLATSVKKDCNGEIPIFIGILNGSFMFVADFIRAYKADCEVSFVKLSSYEGTGSSGNVKELIGLTENLEGRIIIILEDIIDTGNTLEEIFNIFRNKRIKELKIATLFFKP